MRNKKTWSKPELIVLVRGKPEEAVLGTCKIDAGGEGQMGPNVSQYDCWYSDCTTLCPSGSAS